MSTALRPVLRPQHLPSLPSSTSTSATYICQSCRHARLLRRPKRPYTFTQLVTLSDGSAFTMRTTSPVPVYRSNRDTRNAPMWNPTSKDLMSVEDDEAGRLAGFRARFGRFFDAASTAQAVSPTTPEEVVEDQIETDPVQAAVEGKVDTKGPSPQSPQRLHTRQKEREIQFEDEKNEFEEDDMNLLDLINSFGRQNPQQESSKKDKGGKK